MKEALCLPSIIPEKTKTKAKTEMSEDNQPEVGEIGVFFVSGD